MWCMRQAGTLLHPGKSRSLLRECAECSCEWSSRQAASQGAAVIDVHSVCFVPRSVIFLREILRSSDWHISGAASLTSNGSCTAQLSQPHWKARSTGTLRPLSRCGLGLADDVFRNNSSAPHRFCLCRCFSSLIYCANEVVGRVVLCQMAPMSAREAGLGPPSTAQAAKGHSVSPRGLTQSTRKLHLPLTGRHPVAGTHLLKHHCHWVMKMATIFT